MITKKNILVFPCGSGIGLEIYKSLNYSKHFNIIGASSVDDHGKFMYKRYIGGLPYLNDSNFLQSLKKIIINQKIDAIYPSMDSALAFLKKNEHELDCKIVASCLITTEICLSKRATYKYLNDIVNVPKIFNTAKEIECYPVFLKPDIGYGSIGVCKANSIEDIHYHSHKYNDFIIMEYLPGNEFTIDCFTDFNRDLLFVGSRQRKRISRGVSVNTATCLLEEKFLNFAEKINNNLRLNGAWFFQVKENSNGELVLMEIASRMGGSSLVHRVKGINFAELSLFNAFGFPVKIIENNYTVELDRALSCKFKVDLEFNHIYIDFDDTLLVNEKVNVKLVSLIYHFINANKKIHLITKHEKNLSKSLKKYRLDNLFDEIIHLKKNDHKYEFIKHLDAIFIDDSFAEREEIKKKLKISVFSLDMLDIFV